MMVNIPEALNDWTRGLLIDLIEEGYDENEFLEFKSKIDSKTKRIPITTCAFTNTKGGFLIFGIDNTRKKNMTSEEQLVGLEDSDQLKAQINNQIQNIKPNIPIECVRFRDSNIQLPTGRVIVILKIYKSMIGPHQYENIFYKRVSNGNSPMELDEIKENILTSKKSQQMITLLKDYGGVELDLLEAIKLLIDYKDFLKALDYIHLLSMETFNHFLYEHSYLYNEDIQEKAATLVYGLNQLITNQNTAYRRIAGGQEYFDDAMPLFSENVLECINSMKKLEELLNIQYVEPSKSFKRELEDKFKTELDAKIRDIAKETNSLKTQEIQK